MKDKYGLKSLLFGIVGITVIGRVLSTPAGYRKVGFLPYY